MPITYNIDATRLKPWKTNENSKESQQKLFYFPLEFTVSSIFCKSIFSLLPNWNGRHRTATLIDSSISLQYFEQINLISLEISK